MVLFGQNRTVKREENIGYYDSSGNYVAGTRAEITIIADIQVITGEELESLNIGRENVGKVRVFTDEELIIAEEGIDGTDLRNGDYIVFNNEDYEIIQKLDYENNIIPHYEYIGELRK